MNELSFPLELRFKIVAIAPQFSVTDRHGAPVLYIRQKAFKLKESVQVYLDEARQHPLFDIAADRILDFNASYRFRTAEGEDLGAVKRKGMRSLWRSKYLLEDEAGTHEATIREENPWAKVGDSLIGEVPFLGMLSGYLFHPSYLVTSTDGTELVRARKEPAFWEGRFTLEKLGEMDDLQAYRVLLGLVMLILLERNRG
ncbi:MAG: hypothetical protein ACLFR7_11635 [Opitutales bacterium]